MTFLSETAFFFFFLTVMSVAVKNTMATTTFWGQCLVSCLGTSTLHTNAILPAVQMFTHRKRHNSQCIMKIVGP